MSDFSQAGGRSPGAARLSLDLARTIIDDRLREADAFRAAKAASQPSSSVPRSNPRSKATRQPVPVTVRPRRRPRLPIIHRGVAGLDSLYRERNR
jgi:hypothetical protein